MIQMVGRIPTKKPCSYACISFLLSPSGCKLEPAYPNVRHALSVEGNVPSLLHMLYKELASSVSLKLSRVKSGKVVECP